ncbi:MAG: HEAT repeat domain-containing protein [Verrucomicrobiota bacterium]
MKPPIHRLFLIILVFIGSPVGAEPLKPAGEGFQAKIPQELTMERFADASMVENPTTLCLDGKNRVYVGETHRWRIQVQDIRHAKGAVLKERLEDDMQCMTTEDRLAMHQKWSGEKYLEWEAFTREAEVVRQLIDEDGDGKADVARAFRDDFDDALSGPAGGLIAKGDTVYFSNIPAIYALTDADDDGHAEEVDTLVDGFGVRISYSGHDMNGFAWGPDGKLYWSIGDRGYHVEQDGKVFSQPDSGGIFRCDPDGSNFEVFYRRLRNPKEIVFDEYGNLFTVDNDYDNGDLERIEYLIEHGDSGWQMGWQTIASFGNVFFPHQISRTKARESHVDPWMAEGLWLKQFPEQPAFIIPPVEYSGDGPCGFAYHPGVTSFSEEYANNFFIVGYKGSESQCRIERFTLKPEGAGFALDQRKDFLTSIASTDLDWGYDGKLYVSDYIGGWGQPDSGNVFTLFDEQNMNKPELAVIQETFATGFSALDPEALAEFLGHPDMRMRQHAQFALAEKGGAVARPLFEAAAAQGSSLFRRLHGIWGLGQLAVADPSALAPLGVLLHDSEMEVRANAARTLGNHPSGVSPYRKDLIRLLEDESLRVRSLAAIALGNEGHESVIAPAMAMLAANADEDVYVRHGGIMMLTGAASSETLGALSSHENASVRRAAVVALRRQKSPLIAQFFDDQDRLVRAEAVRGAYDENIQGALPALAARIGDHAALDFSAVTLQPLTARRTIYAGWRLGKRGFAQAVAEVAAQTGIDSRVRRDAMVALLDWNTSPIPDPIVGTAFGLPADREKIERGDLVGPLASLIQASPSEVSLAALTMKLVEMYDLPMSRDMLQAYLTNESLPDEARVLALGLLSENPDSKADWANTLKGLFADENVELRSKARSLLFDLDPEAALAVLGETLASDRASTREKQAAIEAITKSEQPKATKILVSAIHQLASGDMDPGVGLELMEAARTKKEHPEMKDAMKAYRASLDATDSMAEWKRLCAEGGDVAKGETVYYNHGAAQCARCHPMHGTGGNVAPELGTIGKLRDADYLVRAMVTPHSEVAEGYGISSITMKDGTALGGMLRPSGDPNEIRLLVGEEEKVLRKDQIASQTPPLSAMPPMGGILTKAQVRDVVAFLAAQRKDRTETEHK